MSQERIRGNGARGKHYDLPKPYRDFDPLEEDMGRYTKNTQRRSFSAEALNSALNAILKDGRKIREVARAFEIHEATLRRKLKIINLMKDERSESLGRAPVFWIAQEKEIVEQL
ncbi:hypothetical protein FQA39_LY10160 [Lamprigera yunnana]|nr:hypothetical protein FQA39_LY10160 [Lamprigera yunnana]